jgi:hypothetical protein
MPLWSVFNTHARAHTPLQTLNLMCLPFIGSTIVLDQCVVTHACVCHVCEHTCGSLCTQCVCQCVCVCLCVCVCASVCCVHAICAFKIHTHTHTHSQNHTCTQLRTITHSHTRCHASAWTFLKSKLHDKTSNLKIVNRSTAVLIVLEVVAIAT